jgi:hypothetical protein
MENHEEKLSNMDLKELEYRRKKQWDIFSWKGFSILTSK